ncbi:MAG TPA: hypothetical protein VHZ52_02375, partial [Acidobacteriaceae bacterium]|nr:hypothetical protein [Acidobacteriaceae bacterium]
MPLIQNGSVARGMIRKQRSFPSRTSSGPATFWSAFRRLCALLAVFSSANVFAPSIFAQSQTAPEPIAHSAANSAGYAGSEACSRCHAGIYKQFSSTAMGRSMSTATPVFLKDATPTPYVNEKLKRRFEVYSKDDKIYQSEAGIGTDGKETFRDEHAVDWIVGAGMNGFGAILQRDQYLFQAPLSFYNKPATWGPSPGYEFVDLGFNRP